MHFWDKHKTITFYYETLTHSICDRFKLTQMEYDILMFLYNNPQYNTASDIVKIRRSTKSHVSTSLKLLEDKGLVEKKLIEIFLPEPAQEIVKAGLDVQKEFMKNMFQGLTEEEMSLWKNIFIKICNNAENCLKER